MDSELRPVDPAAEENGDLHGDAAIGSPDGHRSLLQSDAPFSVYYEEPDETPVAPLSLGGFVFPQWMATIWGQVIVGATIGLVILAGLLFLVNSGGDSSQDTAGSESTGRGAQAGSSSNGSGSASQAAGNDGAGNVAIGGFPRNASDGADDVTVGNKNDPAGPTAIDGADPGDGTGSDGNGIAGTGIDGAGIDGAGVNGAGGAGGPAGSLPGGGMAGSTAGTNGAPAGTSSGTGTAGTGTAGTGVGASGGGTGGGTTGTNGSATAPTSPLSPTTSPSATVTPGLPTTTTTRRISTTASTTATTQRTSTTRSGTVSTTPTTARRTTTTPAPTTAPPLITAPPPTDAVVVADPIVSPRSGSTLSIDTSPVFTARDLGGPYCWSVVQLGATVNLGCAVTAAFAVPTGELTIGPATVRLSATTAAGATVTDSTSVTFITSQLFRNPRDGGSMQAKNKVMMVMADFAAVDQYCFRLRQGATVDTGYRCSTDNSISLDPGSADLAGLVDGPATVDGYVTLNGRRWLDETVNVTIRGR